jgi:hypothetical protein
VVSDRVSAAATGADNPASSPKARAAGTIVLSLERMDTHFLLE